jgi:ABC-type Fe3+ transport system substrate-binding protein
MFPFALARSCAKAWIVAFAVAVVLVGAAAGAESQSLDAIYAKAKAEGTLSLYAGGPTAPWERDAKEFAKVYPGIAITITGGYSNVLDKKIDAQIKSGTLETDLAVFQTLGDFLRWRKEGALLKFKPAGFDKIDASFKDPGGAFVGIAVNAHPYAYNPKLVAPGDVPKSALDFLKPEFRGKVISAYPADDDATMYVFYSIVRKYGWSYMGKYMANQPNFVQGHLGVVRAISAGDALVTFDTVATMSMAQKNDGKPQEIAFSPTDPLPIWPFTAAIFKQAPHPNAAKLFLTWYLSKEKQAKIGTWSVRSDVPPPYGWKPVLSYHVVNSYREFLSDEARLVALRKRFESYTGPVKNVAGVR